MPTRERAAREKVKTAPVSRSQGRKADSDKYDRAEKRLEADADLAETMNRLLVLKPEELRRFVREALYGEDELMPSDCAPQSWRDQPVGTPLSRLGRAAGPLIPVAERPTVLSRINALEVNLGALEERLMEFVRMTSERLAKLEAEVGL